jgi:hypothetical protein
MALMGGWCGCLFPHLKSLSFFWFEYKNILLNKYRKNAANIVKEDLYNQNDDSYLESIGKFIERKK